MFVSGRTEDQHRVHSSPVKQFMTSLTEFLSSIEITKKQKNDLHLN